jgi:predicted acylesterase/phospholipase RssA
LVAAVHALSSTLRGMVHNHFGLCSGMAGTEPGAVPPLTSQFHELFNGLLGRDATKPPVTFGDLWGKSAREGGDREIDLQVITTALNLRRPFRLPNDPGLDPLRAFFYDAKEWGLLFPGEVMKWLVEHPRLPAGPLVKNGRGVQLLSLPEPRNLPVLVAVRLSLSFPGLLSAVPMYTVEPRNGAKPPNTTKDGAFLATKVYFSDGGITSNCPIHLFDVPLPGHPTFGVRLDTFRPGERGRYRVSLPDDGSDAPFDTRSPVRAAWQFVSGIVGTALDWRDRLQRRLPGYRERIVVVALKPEEGGLNLAMTRRTITRVAALGSVAARRLQDAFEGSRANGRGNAWDRHRWLRLHSTLAAAQRYATELHKSRTRGDVDYRDLLDLLPSMDPRLTDHAALAQAKALLDRLSELPKGDPAVPSRDLGENAPQPPPRLRMSPPW